MKILVTGSEGLIGAHLVKELEARGHAVTGYDVTSGKDVRDFPGLKAATKGKDAVVHLAALCNSTDSVNRPLEYFTSNDLGTFQALEAARQEGARKFIFAASAAALDPMTPYGLGKLHSEQWCNLFAHVYKMKVYNLRFYNVYGPGDEKGVVNIFARQLKAGRPVQVYGNGAQTRDYISVHDVCRMVRKFLEEEIPFQESYEIGTGRRVSVNELIEIMARQIGTRPQILWMPPRPGDILHSSSKKPFPGEKIPIEEGVKELLEKA